MQELFLSLFLLLLLFFGGGRYSERHREQGEGLFLQYHSSSTSAKLISSPPEKGKTKVHHNDMFVVIFMVRVMVYKCPKCAICLKFKSGTHCRLSAKTPGVGKDQGS